MATRTGWRAAWRRLWSSVSFRLALNYGVLTVTTALLLLGFFHYQSHEVLNAQLGKQVTVSAQRLASHYERGGLNALVIEIQMELIDNADTDTEIFMLQDAHGRIVAGNLDQVPDLTQRRSLVEQEVSRAGQAVRGLLAVLPLSGGEVLVVGQDLRDLQSLNAYIRSASVIGAVLALALGLGGALLFRRALQRRVEVIRQTARSVGAGELTHRVPHHGHEDEFVLLTEDINDMLDRIERLMAGVRNVSDAAAHNLRTPLARVLSRLQGALLQDDPARWREANAYAVAQLQDLASLLEKLLEIAEMESGSRRAPFARCDLRSIAHDVADLYEAVAEEAGIRLRLDLPSLPLQGDAELLASALANLIENSLKYAGAGATIVIEARQGADGLQLTVRDTGPGVPPERLARLGERFYRAHQGICGFGLGLASVAAVAKLHGGKLRLRNAAPGFVATLELPGGR